MDKLIAKQRQYFQSGKTLPVSFSIQMLKRLRDAVNKYEAEICEALKADIGKSDYEALMHFRIRKVL